MIMKPNIIGVMLIGIGLLIVLVLFGIATFWYLPIIVVILSALLFSGWFLAVYGDNWKRELRMLFDLED